MPTVVPWGALQGDESDDLLNPEVGLFWGVLPEHRRLGYATEAASALLDFLFGKAAIAAGGRHDRARQPGLAAGHGQAGHAPAAKPTGYAGSWCQIVGVPGE